MAKQSSNGEAETKPQPKVNWDDSAMETTYANVVNAASTREEVNVALSNRIILNPYAAKRLAIVLGAVVTQYESRFGPLSVTKDARDKKEK